MRILAFICLLILSGLTGLYSQDTGDVQVKSGYVKVPEGSLYYEEAGTGEPLIFIHGHSLDRGMNSSLSLQSIIELYDMICADMAFHPNKRKISNLPMQKIWLL